MNTLINIFILTLFLAGSGNLHGKGLKVSALEKRITLGSDKTKGNLVIAWLEDPDGRTRALKSLRIDGKRLEIDLASWFHSSNYPEKAAYKDPSGAKLYIERLRDHTSSPKTLSESEKKYLLLSSHKDKILTLNTEEGHSYVVKVKASEKETVKKAALCATAYWNRAAGRSLFDFVPAEDPPSPYAASQILITSHAGDSGASYTDVVVSPRTAKLISGHVMISDQIDKLEHYGLEAELFFKDKRLHHSEKVGLFCLQIAHELGHLIGLAHNFAGSNFIDHSNPEDPLPSSSMMDYLSLRDKLTLVKRLEVDDSLVLPYDKEALALLFKKDHKLSQYAFCSDAQTSLYRDCNKFDRGALPIEDLLLQVALMQNFSAELLDQFYYEYLKAKRELIFSYYGFGEFLFDARHVSKERLWQGVAAHPAFTNEDLERFENLKRYQRDLEKLMAMVRGRI